MPSTFRLFRFLAAGCFVAVGGAAAAQAVPGAIDRKALVERHRVVNTTTDTLSSLSVGNGAFAFTADITGLQTFPAYYEKGVPLGTESEWGWHRFPNKEGYQFAQSLREYVLNGRPVSYSVQVKTPGNKDAVDYLRANPHRLQLGNFGFRLLKKNGQPATIHDLRNIRQVLNPWTGELTSHFTLEGTAVDVITVGHQQQDAIAVRVESALLKTGRLKLALRFPFPTAGWADMGTDYSHNDQHRSAIVSQQKGAALLSHQLDTTRYTVALGWAQAATLAPVRPHEFVLSPGKAASVLEVSCRFAPRRAAAPLVSFAATRANSRQQWEAFWKSGGAVDFSGSTDPRARELERRIVLSQYLTKLQNAGSQPPQETGLVLNSWYGRPHLEMHWWHSAHFALWGRPALLEKSLTWYARPDVQAVARGIARRQGYAGVRWQKMTDPWGEEGPSSVGAFLLWQQPHTIYFAEEAYRAHPNAATLKLYQERVFATADFIASYPFFEKDKNRYILGKGVIPAQERFKAEDTFNPTFELVYWHWALATAQQWHERLGQPHNAQWDEVLQKLSALPQAGGVYLAAESAPDSYTNPEYKTDHPSVLAALGMMPATGQVDPATMRRTFDLIWKDWNWDKTWGWDFPMTAMTATRLGLPDRAVDALLMKVRTNTYLPSGHNYQEGRLPIYLPGNGGLLAAVALMCAGYDGCPTQNPGIPKTGWQVRWEGLQKMP
ncbi:hypothetical protein Q3A66_17390 [Hymenobacter sp. BT770]|uniref:hypothetical protein n=1 Tax=Hymenobacter sp. BT770 TaxID=2886942 RepID=UPI001D10999F|nr:hypothetical protein [Hymenobacter sp. BT770]MCC3154949.1 hypothetical protein [Hymenobacter sp. BT770]MDO3416845.1 hypothetical protein [Hymenobacter sp. BT770]